MTQDKVRCDVCKEEFRATPFHINLICKGCFNKRPPDATGKELIEKILKELGKVLINEINMKDGDLILVDIIKNLEEMKKEDTIEPK